MELELYLFFPCNPPSLAPHTGSSAHQTQSGKHIPSLSKSPARAALQENTQHRPWRLECFRRTELLLIGRTPECLRNDSGNCSVLILPIFGQSVLTIPTLPSSPTCLAGVETCTLEFSVSHCIGRPPAGRSQGQCWKLRSSLWCW